MSGEIFIETDDVVALGLDVGEHLYLVFRDVNGDEYVLRSGPENGFPPYGQMKIEVNVPIEASADTRGDETPQDRASTPLDFVDLTDDEVWAIMVKYARLIDDADYDYELLEENSNAFIGAMIFAAGGDPLEMLPSGMAADDFVGLSSWDNIVDDVTPPDDGVVYGTEAIDVIVGLQIDEFIRALNGDDVVQAGRGNDAVWGGLGDDALHGEEGNDDLSGGGGNDMLDGGAGIDIASFSAASSRFLISIIDGAAQITVADKTADGDGTDTLASIERLDFADGFSFGAEGLVDTSLLTGVLDTTVEQLTTFVEMYIAYFDRAPDATGLFYWGSRLADGMSLPEIAASFFVQPESKAIYTDPDDNAQLVDDVYWNLLEREPEEAGRTYWINALDKSDVTRPEFMLAIINGAKAETGSPDDVRVIEDKGKIGLSYAVVNGLTDVQNAKTAMAVYDRDAPDTTLGEADSLIESFRVAAAAPESDELIVELVGFMDDPLALT